MTPVTFVPFSWAALHDVQIILLKKGLITIDFAFTNSLLSLSSPILWQMARLSNAEHTPDTPAYLVHPENGFWFMYFGQRSDFSYL